MKKIKVLFIEDNMADVRLIREFLLDDLVNKYELVHITRLDQISEESKNVKFDVVLLDLNLSDINGTETFMKMKAILPAPPVIILTGLKDELVAEKMIQHGAQDYLVKGTINTPLLTRSIRYAIDRDKLTFELLKSEQLENQKREIENLDLMPHSHKSKVTEQLLGIKSLKESSPETFFTLSTELANIMEKSVESKLYKTNYDIPNHLRDFTEALGHLFVGPHDVVELYSFTLKKKIKGLSTEKSKVYVEEGRMIIIMLMGYLAAFYKKYAPFTMIFKDSQKK